MTRSKTIGAFTTLRSRPPEPRTQPEKRRCARCKAVLSDGNHGTLCAPCDVGKVELPEWALELAEHVDQAAVSAIAATIRAGLVRRAKPPIDPDAPFCSCGCKERTLRAMRSHSGKQRRTGPYQRFVRDHRPRVQGKGALVVETAE